MITFCGNKQISTQCPLQLMNNPQNRIALWGL